MVEKENNAFRELRRRSGMTQRAFCQYFSIPRRTVENWDSGVSKCPEYLLALMQYKLDHEKTK
jgi:DNA-binding transcriptional regulator YiaG